MADKVKTTKEVTLSDGSKVTIRQPKLRDVRPFLDEPNVEIRQLKVLAVLTQKTDDELDDMFQADVAKLMKAAESFL